jgi:hypothetical protein
MTNSSGNLSIDFLVGFTIFMMAFIWVATLVPNLFLGISSHGIDFDAVAYRTGAILAEDPGATVAGVSTPWEVQQDTGNANIERFGLAVSKETPNILSETKVNRFFNTTVFVTEDYRKKAIFGDYPYRFNISLQDAGESQTKYVGEVRPGNYGFIRREVKIKHFTNATIDKTDIQNLNMTNTGFDGNVSYHDFSIVINRTELLYGNITKPVINPNYKAAYQIDPRSDAINITIDDLQEKPYPVPGWVTDTPAINLTSVSLSQSVDDISPPVPLTGSKYTDFIFINNTLDTPVNPPVDDVKNITLIFKPGFFSGPYDRGAIYINMTFGVSTHVTDLPLGPRDQGMQYLNSSRSGPWDYNYNATQVTQPELTDGVLEVAVW